MNQRNQLPAVRDYIQSDRIQNALKQRLNEKSGAFVASILELVNDDTNLAKCDPRQVLVEAMKAATLDLPLSKSLGYAYVIPYKNRPVFQIGYQGYIQLALRTGQYRHINADCIYEGEEIIPDRLRGIFSIEGQKTSDKIWAYFAYLELISNFQKSVYMTREQVESHAKKFSKSYDNPNGPWSTDFDAMAKKTVLRKLIPKFGPLSIEPRTERKTERPADRAKGEPHELTYEPIHDEPEFLDPPPVEIDSDDF